MSSRRMRMAELSRESGVSKDTIHFYLREGLLPRPHKTGKTVAFYDDAHLERLRLIRRLRDERYLPLAVIRRMLETGQDAPHDRDLETLADVLSIDPTLRRTEGPPPASLDDAVNVALERGLLGDGIKGADLEDATEARVLAAVGEALALDDEARELTLRDMQASARALRRLVEAEAQVFFNHVIESGDMPASVRALRSGRPAVARFLTAYRDLVLRRIAEDLLGALGNVAGVPPMIPLSQAARHALGLATRRDELFERARAGDAAAANDAIWLAFVTNPSELGELAPRVWDLLRPRARCLVRLVTQEAGESGLAELNGSFPLGEVLDVERDLGRISRAGGAMVDQMLPLLGRLSSARPEDDADPLASAAASTRRGLLGVWLPRLLGRALGAGQDLERVLSVVVGAPGRIEPATRATLEGNARLGLGRWYAEQGDPGRAVRHLERARDIDPSGPIGQEAEVRLASFAAD